MSYIFHENIIQTKSEIKIFADQWKLIKFINDRISWEEINKELFKLNEWDII